MALHKALLRNKDFRGSKFKKTGVAKKFFSSKEAKRILNQGQERRDVYKAFKKAAKAKKGRLNDKDIAEVIEYLGQEHNSISKKEGRELERMLERQGLSMKHATSKGYRHARKSWARPLTDTTPKVEPKRAAPLLSGSSRLFGGSRSGAKKTGTSHSAVASGMGTQSRPMMRSGSTSRFSGIR